MSPDDQKLVLSVEQSVLVAPDTTSLTSLSGFVNFTAILTDEMHACKI